MKNILINLKNVLHYKEDFLLKWKYAMKVYIIYRTIDVNKKSLFLRVYENTMETQPVQYVHE